MKPNFKIHEFSLESIENIFGKTTAPIDKNKYIYDYLNTLKTIKGFGKITIVEEIDYIDKFYLRDYSRYYSQSFDGFDSHSSRLHFFSCDFDEDEFYNMLQSNSQKDNIIKKKDEANENDPYLGHITVKPVKDAFESKLMGRTALSVYPKEDGSKIRKYITVPNHCSLFGIDLSINSIPFHQQDIAVGACASACLWMTQFVVNNWFSTQISSLSEITELSRLLTAYSYPSPVFPSGGLATAEMVNYIQTQNLHFHILDIPNLRLEVRRLNQNRINVNFNEMIEDIIKAYVGAGFPIICGIRFTKNDSHAGAHAVLLSGYKEEADGIINEIYLHDDQIGPYCKTNFCGANDNWENDWIFSGLKDKITLYKIIIPVDPLVKLDFLRCAPNFYKAKNQTYKSELNIYHVSEYKKSLLEKSFRDKSEILSMNMPRYIWVIRLFENDDVDPTRDIVFDANRTFMRRMIVQVIFD